MDVSVRLREIDEDNWMDVVFLSTEDEEMPRICEKYVASNALSIVQAVYEGTWNVRAVYCGKCPVGFAMFGYNKEHDLYEICRLMIDRKHQGKGFGQIALRLVIEEILSLEECEEIYLTTNPENVKAKRMYERCGFVNTGKMLGQEELYCWSMEKY
ncbi:MAG: GNAT family N-acetyltransferase [Lachnospiraceae bacterium]|nr:GNAT family N-acetyltransferase [Lachnospiraceae bacterium]